MKKLIIFLLTVFTAGSAIVAQDSLLSQQISLARLNYIMMKIPEMKQIEAELEDFEDQLKQMYDSKVSEYEEKYKEYLSIETDLSNVIRKTLETDLVTLQQSISNFESNSQYSFLEKQNSLIKPVKKKVFESIEQVARDYNLFLILNADIDEFPTVLYYEDAMDISDAVLSRLGVDSSR